MRRGSDGFAGSAAGARRSPATNDAAPAAASFRTSRRVVGMLPFLRWRHASTTGRPFSWMRGERRAAPRPARRRRSGSGARPRERGTLGSPSTHWRAASGGSMSDRPDAPRTTVLTLQQKKDRGERITMLTAYDFPTASLVDAAGVDAVLVGDSLAMVVLGHETTLAVTMDEMLHHARAVSRGARRALLRRRHAVPQLPGRPRRGRAQRRPVPEGSGHGRREARGRARGRGGGARRSCAPGSRSMGHIGLQPQSVHRLGGFRVQGRTAEAALALVDDARRLEEAGCFALVLESVPARVAEAITARLRIPTIGIGAGSGHGRAGAGAPRPRRPHRDAAAVRRAPRRGRRARSSGRPRRSGARSSRAPFPAPSTPSRCPRRSGRLSGGARRPPRRAPERR